MSSTVNRFLFFGAAVFAAKSVDKNVGTKIGVIDLNKILMDSPQVNKAKDRLKKKFEKEEKKITKAQKKFQSTIEKFNKNGPTMKAEDKKKEEKKIIDEQTKLQKMQAKFQQDVGEAQNKAMKDILKKVEDVVNKTSKKKNLDIVITKASLAYNKPELEITEEVIKQLKKAKK